MFICKRGKDCEVFSGNQYAICRWDHSDGHHGGRVFLPVKSNILNFKREEIVIMFLRLGVHQIFQNFESLYNILHILTQ